MSDPHASASTPAEDEPKTPMWLPALGAALFISVGLWWAVTPGAAAASTDQPAASASAPATAAPTAAPTPQPTPAPRPAVQGLAPAPIAPGVLPSRRPAPGNLPPGAQPPAGQRTRPNP